MLQKLETKQFQDLSLKAQTARESAEKRFDQEMSVSIDLELFKKKRFSSLKKNNPKDLMYRYYNNTTQQMKNF